MGDFCTKHDPSVRHSYANRPSDAVQEILQILESRAATKQKRMMVKIAVPIAHQRARTFQLQNPVQRLETLIRDEIIGLEVGSHDARSRMICNRA